LPEDTPRLIESHRIYTEDLRALLPRDLAKKLAKHPGPVSLLALANHYSELEKTGGGRPPIWEMIFWWTRKPLAGARFVIASSLLPEDTDVKALARALRFLDRGSPHALNPDLAKLPPEHRSLIEEASLLDPFAGYGNIPLEAARLGLARVVASDLLPVAYVLLKAILEYPSRHGREKTLLPHREAQELADLVDWQALKKRGLARETPSGIEAPALIAELARAAKRILDELRNDPDLRELYDPDTAVYIGTWEIRCPHSGKYSPMVGNWWLARVRKGDTPTRLAYMKPRITDKGEVEIEDVDLNKIHGDVSRATIQDNTIRINGKTYQVPEPNIAPRSNTATCLQDGHPLGYIDPETGRHYIDKKHAPPEARKRLEWYPKWAIKQWNRLYEQYLKGEITLEQLKNAPARPRIIAKAKTANRDIEFQPATPSDTEKLWKAAQKLREQWPDPDIPTEPIPQYDTRSIWVVVYGFDKWFKLFNPRQLLTLTKTTKQIRKQTQKTPKHLQEPITTYLAIALARYAGYNSALTYIDTTNPWGIKVAYTLALRGIAMQWNFGETHPLATISRITSLQDQSSLIKNLNKVVIILLNILNISESSKDIRVDLNDVVLVTNKNIFTVIVTDPPYWDDVPYSELSDFYYVWLKRALSDVEGGRLVPRFLGEAFFRRVGGRWVEVRTQWEEVARREISVNLGRLGDVDKARAVDWFERRLGAAFRNISRLLGEDGLFVTYYNHTSVDAWASLVRAGWEIGGLRVSAAVPLVTESGTRVTARGKVRLDTSIVVVWRRRVGGGVCDAGVVEREALEEARRFVFEMVRGGVVRYDLLFAALGRALSVLTRCGRIVGPGGALSARDVAEAGYRVAGRAVAEALTGALGVTVASAAGRFYLLTRLFFAEAGDIRLDGSAVGLLQIGLGVSRDEAEGLRLLERPRRGDVYPLLYPRRADRRALRELLERRGLSADPGRAAVRSSVDVLHLLYYAAVSGGLGEALEALRGRAGGLVEEALAIARVLCRYLPGDDPERGLACRVVRAAGVSGEEAGLERWIKEV